MYTVKKIIILFYIINTSIKKVIHTLCAMAIDL